LVTNKKFLGAKAYAERYINVHSQRAQEYQKAIEEI
jgi:hypothetical protein